MIFLSSKSGPPMDIKIYPIPTWISDETKTSYLDVCNFAYASLEQVNFSY